MKKDKNEPELAKKNEQVRHNRVLVIHEGNKLGIMSSRDAQFKARDLGLDLVEVAPNADPPVCVIMDYGKYQYEKNKKSSGSKKSTIKEKEFSLRYVIDEHDLQTKMNQAKKYLDKGNRVKLIVKFKARENAHKEKGWTVINRAVELLAEHGTPEKPANWEGNRIAVKLINKKEK